MHVLRSVVAVCVLAATSGALASSEQAGRGDAASEIATLPYKLVEWPTPPTSAAGVPGAWNFIQVSSVAVTPRGTILVLHRGAHPILEFDSKGTLLRSWGDGLFSEGKVAAIPQTHWTDDKSHYSAVYGPAGCTACGAHSVRVDPRGNIWVIDAPGHVVYQLNPEGKEIMRLGTKGSAGTDRSHFNLPTDVAFAPNGDLYVSDGYGSARVVKFSHDGKYLSEWGTRGKGPGQFGLPHNLVVDAQGRYVADRDNQRIEVFDRTVGSESPDRHRGVSGLFITRTSESDGRSLAEPDGKAVDCPGPRPRGAWSDSQRLRRRLPGATQRRRSKFANHRSAATSSRRRAAAYYACPAPARASRPKRDPSFSW